MGVSFAAEDDDTKFIVDQAPSARMAEPDADDTWIDPDEKIIINAGRLQELKKKEKELQDLLALLRKEKNKALDVEPLTIGVVGFGNFGQFISKTFSRHAKIVAMSRSDYTEQAEAMGGSYVPLSEPERFFSMVDVVVFMTSIKSFQDTLRKLLPAIEADQKRRKEVGESGPLFADVLSVKEWPRKIMLNMLPPGCDVICTHPMFGPISGADGWTDLKFIYEKTRCNGKLMRGERTSMASLRKKRVTMAGAQARMMMAGKIDDEPEEKEQAEKEGLDRMDRFLSIWEEEGCHMEEMTCKDHDIFAAKSQFLTHLMGRVLGKQNLEPTPVDTKGFESVLALTHSVNADSFDLFYGLYKYNNYALDTIFGIRSGIDEVVDDLRKTEREYF
jgi:prephenate dehydrogenase